MFWLINEFFIYMEEIQVLENYIGDIGEILQKKNHRCKEVQKALQ